MRSERTFRHGLTEDRGSGAILALERERERKFLSQHRSWGQFQRTAVGLNAEPVSFLRREADNGFHASGVPSNYSATSKEGIVVATKLWL